MAHISEWAGQETDSFLEGELQEGRSRRDATTWDLDIDYTGVHKAQDKFTQEANRVVTKWVEKNPKKAEALIESDDYESEDDIAWNTWAGIVGHGVGFWEHMDRADYDSLEKAFNKDKKLAKAKQNLEDEMMNAAWMAIVEDNIDSFTEYLNDTLIPDLKESGAEYTAEDFETLVGFLENPKRKKSQGRTVQEFADFLENTLIPDLKESGKEYTAEDFEEGLGYLEDTGRVKLTQRKFPNPSRPRPTAATPTRQVNPEPTKKLKSKLLR